MHARMYVSVRMYVCVCTYDDSVKALLRRYQGSIKALFSLYEGSIKYVCVCVCMYL